MHFSKTYQQLLRTLPPELSDSAIEYRKLKKLINQVVKELSGLGLTPEVLQHALQQHEAEDQSPASLIAEVGGKNVKVFYEVVNSSDHLEPRLRLRVESDGTSSPHISSIPLLSGDSLDVSPEREDVYSLSEPQRSEMVDGTPTGDEAPMMLQTPGVQMEQCSAASSSNETIIPLVSDTAFFDLLLHHLQSLSERLSLVRADFESNLHSLSQHIAATARPVSSTSVFRPSSWISEHPSAVQVHTHAHFLSTNKSDLYAWREVLELYVEADIFESHQEASRGERLIEDSEQRLNAFTAKLAERRLIVGHRFKLKESRQALQNFVELLTFLLNLKKFQFATAEATRKILKKHAKRTALPLVPTLSAPDFLFPPQSASFSYVLPAQAFPQLNALVPAGTASLSKLLGQAVGAQLLPIIPHIDDYSCAICTSIAFKPIRLQCSHLFCVRCLIKMQKRGEDHCPFCRAPTVLAANRANVDWALMNFMKDWFPREAREKLKQNEKEAAEDDLRALGIDVDSCIIV